jgi:uncharacterized protein (UPF0254 family)
MQKTFDDNLMRKLDRTIRLAKRIARRYRELTGKPLGITGEVGEIQAARLLGLVGDDMRYFTESEVEAAALEEIIRGKRQNPGRLT